MNDISISPGDAPNMLAKIVDQFCAMPMDYNDIPVKPEDADGPGTALLSQAAKSAESGDLERAFSLIEGRQNASFEFNYLMGKILFQARLWFEAAEALRLGAQKFGGYGELWFMLGMANYQMGLLTEAFANWTEAVRANENHEDARLTLKLADIIINHTNPELHPEAAAMIPLVSGKGIDVGCGARKTHPEAIGVDLTTGGDTGNLGGEAGRVSAADVLASGDDLPMFGDGELDYVIARHNLEHYIDPVKTLMEWTRVLKPGGVIGLILPDDDAFDTIHADETHTHVFTQTSLNTMVSLLPELAAAETGVAEKNWSFYAILQKVAPGEKADYPYREKVNQALGRLVESRANLSMQAMMNDICAASLKTLALLRPGSALPADPDSLYPFPFKTNEIPQVLVSGDEGLRIAMLQYRIGTPDWVYTLSQMGHTVLDVPFGHDQKISFQTEKTIKSFRPHFVVSANYRPYVAQSMALFNIPYVGWALDTFALEDYWRRDLASDNTFLFHFSKSAVDRHRETGLSNCHWLPLAANTERFRPFVENPLFSCGAGFVGVSATVNGYTELLRKLRERLMNPESSTNEKNEIFSWIRKLGIVIEMHRDELVRWRGEQFFRETSASEKPACLDAMTGEAILFALGDQITTNHRARLMTELAPAGVHLWGDNWWKNYESLGATYKGHCDYHEELPEIYSSTKVNIHTNRIYHQDVTPLRVFDILACRGFLLAEHRDAYGDCYEIGKDLVCYKSPGEAAELTRYYLNHPEERMAIAENGYRKTVEKHSLTARWNTIIETLEQAGAIALRQERRP